MGTQTDVRSYDDVMKLRQQTLVDLPGSKGGTWSSRLTQSTHRFIRSGVNRRNRDAIRRKISSSVLSIGRGAFLYPWLIRVALLSIVGLQLAQAGQGGATVRVEQIYDADGQRVGKRVIALDGETGAFRTNEQRFLLEGLNPTWSKSGPVRWGYAGEVWDSQLGMYELRARQYRPEHGRFWTLDTFEGRPGEPLSLHKYLYCHGSPVDLVDPSG